jgi:uncharacterized membrane protein YvbJ
VAIDFEKHKKEISSDPNRVRCAHCGSWVATRAGRCASCGVHFKGEAFQFAHRSDELEGERSRRSRRMRIGASIIAVLFLLGVITFFAQ